MILSYQISCLQIWQSGISKPLNDATSLLWFLVLREQFNFFSTGMARNQRAISDKVYKETYSNGKVAVKRVTSIL